MARHTPFPNLQVGRWNGTLGNRSGHGDQLMETVWLRADSACPSAHPNYWLYGTSHNYCQTALCGHPHGRLHKLVGASGKDQAVWQDKHEEPAWRPASGN
ncbi:MAG: hypothetical protein IPP40_04610 [bacterium]|nr:hypothetical protein [bacterium]